MKRLLVFLTMTLLLTSCGGGGGNTISTIETPTLTAYYVDAPVKGLIYEASPSGLSGVTDDRGAFKFKKGDNVSLYLDPLNRINFGTLAPVEGGNIFSLTDLKKGINTYYAVLTLYSFNIAPQGSSIIDVTNLKLKNATAEALKNLLERRSIPGGYPKTYSSEWDPIAVMKSLRSDETSLSFRVSDPEMNYTSFNNFAAKLLESLNDLTVGNDFNGSGSVTMSAGGQVFHFHEGKIDYFSNDLRLRRDTYSQSNGGLYIYDTSDTTSRSCDLYLRLKSKNLNFSNSIYTQLNSPTDCGYQPNVNNTISGFIVSKETLLNDFMGRTLIVGKEALCGFGEGDIALRFGDSISTIKNDLEVALDGTHCQEKIGGLGNIAVTEIPGVMKITLPSAAIDPITGGGYSVIFFGFTDYEEIAVFSRKHVPFGELPGSNAIRYRSVGYSSYKLVTH